MNGENDDRGARWKRALSQPLEMWSWNHQRPAITARRPVNPLKDRGRGSRGTEKRKMKDMTVETLNFIILCMGLLFVMAGILLIVGKLAGKRPASIAGGVLMIAWGLFCGIPELRSWMLARATDLEHTLEAMWAGLDGDGRMFVYILALWLMGAIVIMVGGRR